MRLMTAPGDLTMTLRIRCRYSAQSALMYASRVLAIAGCAALGYSGAAVLDGLLYQSVTARQFEKSLRAPVVPSPALQPLLRALTPQSNALAKMEIPRLGVSVVVSEGTSARILRLGAGHIAGTALPGEAGNVGVAGHRDTFFRRLRNVQPGDTIRFTTLRGTSQYAVQWTKIVKPSDAAVLGSSSESLLTLVTCYPFSFVGKAPNRFIVRALRVPNP